MDILHCVLFVDLYACVLMSKKGAFMGAALITVCV